MIGVLTTAAMVCFVRGFTIGEASVVGPMEYTRLVYAALIGFFIFSEVPDAGTWIGAAIIVASTIYIARHEAKAGGRAPIG
jgi:drug/metabolite transporter (DMT)-like permease